VATSNSSSRPIRIGISLCLLGGLLTASSVGGWYQTLAKPSWTPPDSVFGPLGGNCM